MAERDPFFECFWATPELPTPQIKGQATSVLPPAMAGVRLTVRLLLQHAVQCRTQREREN